MQLAMWYLFKSTMERVEITNAMLKGYGVKGA